MSRPSWDEWGLSLAAAVATRADCSRRQVGAVLMTPDRSIVAQGYNGAPAGTLSCIGGDCPRGTKTTAEVPGYDQVGASSYDVGPGTCIALHAEQNALLRASWFDMADSTLYVTHEPCPGCLRMISGTPIARVVHPGGVLRLHQGVVSRFAKISHLKVPREAVEEQRPRLDVQVVESGPTEWRPTVVNSEMNLSPEEFNRIRRAWTEGDHRGVTARMVLDEAPLRDRMAASLAVGKAIVALAQRVDAAGTAAGQVRRGDDGVGPHAGGPAGVPGPVPGSTATPRRGLLHRIVRMGGFPRAR